MILGSGDVTGISGPGVAFAFGTGTVATAIGASRETGPSQRPSNGGGGVANKSSPSRVRNLLHSSHQNLFALTAALADYAKPSIMESG